MATKWRCHPGVLDYVSEGAARELNARQILIGLEGDERLAQYAPNLRTVQRMVREMTADDPSGPWSLAADDGTDARVVLDVITFLIKFTEGRRSTVTRDEAQWIKKLSRAARELSPLQLYLATREYNRREAAGESTEGLDVWLAFEPWRESEYGKRMEEAEAQRRAEEVGESEAELWWGHGAYRDAVAQGWIEDVEPNLVMQLATKSER